MSERMDEKVLEAWKEIANRPADMLVSPVIHMYRSDLKILVDEIYRLRESENNE